MKDVVYVTGNSHKAEYFSKLAGLDIDHVPADVEEIQSLDAEKVIKAKAIEAYRILKRPVLIEDTSLIITCLNRLPGTFIKWFLEELGQEGLCRLADADPERRAIASCIFAYYDGKDFELIRGSNKGTIALRPQGTSGFGWNVIFIPEGCSITLGEMDETKFEAEYLKIKPMIQVRQFLDK